MNFSSSPFLVAASHRTIQFLFRSAFLADKKENKTKNTKNTNIVTKYPTILMYNMVRNNIHFDFLGYQNTDAKFSE
jgi:hypothetical protein